MTFIFLSLTRTNKMQKDFSFPYPVYTCMMKGDKIIRYIKRYVNFLRLHFSDNKKDYCSKGSAMSMLFFTVYLLLVSIHSPSDICSEER